VSIATLPTWETDLGEIPRVTCHGGQINQVVLNLVVNAAHAIADSNKGKGVRGKIVVRTREENGLAVISISDTGGGIPDAIRARIFDPFFTHQGSGSRARARDFRYRATSWSKATAANSTSPPKSARAPRSSCGCRSAVSAIEGEEPYR
jgi:signal transduction histidine kinase